LDDDPLLPAACCDLALVVNTYHHFPDGPAYLRKLARTLRPGGRLANIDFHRRETPVGPPVFVVLRPRRASIAARHRAV